MANYSCDVGYKLEGQGNGDTRVSLKCMANESHAMWDESQPRCERM